ncbi:MAG: hypothetical protein F4X93_02280 [Proteobacteria bacterium]|nr:hypothetical protein [Pseudomonadota bacterium]
MTANFYKHADRDPEDVHIHHSWDTDLLIYDCCVRLDILTGAVITGARCTECNAFLAWFTASYPPEEKYEVRIKGVPVIEMNRRSRLDFGLDMLHYMYKGKNWKELADGEYWNTSTGLVKPI